MGLLIGFTTILVVIAAGAALAHVGVLDLRSQRTLGEIAFFVASPALMVVTISRVHLEAAASNLVASAVSLGACFTAYVVLARLRSGGISLVVDLVLNHVAAEHAWADAARDGDPHHRDFFHAFPDLGEPDRIEDIEFTGRVVGQFQTD